MIIVIDVPSSIMIEVMEERSLEEGLRTHTMGK